MKGKHKYVANVIACVPLLVKVKADNTEEAIEKIRKKVHKQIDMVMRRWNIQLILLQNNKKDPQN